MNFHFISFQEALVRDHRGQEEGKRVAVDNAVKDLLNRDTMYRNELRKQVEEKLKKAEINRKKQEISRAMSLTESKRWVAVQLNNSYLLLLHF